MRRELRAVRAMVWAAAFLSVVAGGIYPSRAQARSEKEIREEIEQVLMERHPTDTMEWWRSLGPQTPQIVISMYEETSQIHRRLKLLQGLGAFDTRESTEFLRSQAQDTNESAIRHTAIRAVGRAQGAAAADFVSQFLSNADPQTRYTAADTLKKMNDPQADAAVEKYLKDEKVPWIAKKLEGQLPKPTGVLTPVTSSEDRLSAAFEGEWQGLWILPKGAAEAGLSSRSVAVRLRVESPSALQGEIEAQGVKKPAGASEKWSLSKLSGKGTRVKGVLVLPASEQAKVRASNRATPKEVELEIELIERAGSTLIEAEAKAVGGYLLLRKTPVVKGAKSS